MAKVNFKYFFNLEDQDATPSLVSIDCKSTFENDQLAHEVSFIKSTANHWQLSVYFFLTIVPVSQKVPGSERSHYFLDRALPRKRTCLYNLLRLRD